LAIGLKNKMTSIQQAAQSMWPHGPEGVGGEAGDRIAVNLLLNNGMTQEEVLRTLREVQGDFFPIDAS
jgi:hypothetical protein